MIPRLRSAAGRPHLITFDLDGTLLDDRTWQPTIRRTCQRLALMLQLDAERLLAANADVWSEFWPTVEDAWTLGGLDGAAVTAEAWKQTLERAGYPVTHASTASRIYMDERMASLRPYPDVTEALADLRGSAALALVTNGASDTQRTAISKLGLHEWFSTIVISGEIGVAKPDPAIFRAALEQVGTDAALAWHVGDGLATDVAGALAGGMRAIWLNRSARRRPVESAVPHHEIRNMAQLADLFMRAHAG